MPDEVSLRPWRPADVEPCLELLNDPETVRWSSYPSPASIDDARRILQPDEPVLVFVVDVGGEFAGLARATTNNEASASVDLAIHPSHRKRGTATRALGLLADLMFDEAGAPALVWPCQVGDYRAWRVAWHNGFSFAATMPSAIDHHGVPRDAWVTSLVRDDAREPATTWISPVPLEVGDLLIRDQKATDEERFVEAMNDPESTRWLGTIPGMPRTSDEFRAAMRRHLLGASLGEMVTWTVADRSSDSYLGSITLFGFTSLDYRSAEVGYRTHPDARGRGVLTRSLRTVLTHAFAPESQGGLGLERISLGAGDGNLASQGVARSLGFTETGRDRQCYDLPDGTVVDLIRFDLLRSEFTA